MKSVQHVIEELLKFMTILTEFIRQVVTSPSDIYRRLCLVIQIFKSSSEKTLKRMLTLVTFFGKFEKGK